MRLTTEDAALRNIVPPPLQNAVNTSTAVPGVDSVVYVSDALRLPMSLGTERYVRVHGDTQDAIKIAEPSLMIYDLADVL